MKSNHPLVVVSILSWNNHDATSRCLSSVLADVYENIIIVVTDNGSVNVIPDTIKQQFPDVVFRCNAKNLGFAGGHNGVLTDAIFSRAQYFWILNNDAVVCPGCLSTLVETCDSDATIGLASPVIRYLSNSGKIEFLAATLDFKNFACPRLHTSEEVQAMLADHPQTIWLTGTALLITRRFLEKNPSGFNEELFAYYEDNDLCVRSINLGFFNRPILNASVLHDSPIDNSTRASHYYYLMHRNAWLFWTSHISKLEKFRYFFVHLSRLIILADKLRRPHPEKSNACLFGTFDAFCGRYGEPKLDRHLPGWLLNLILFAPYKKAKCLRALSLGVTLITNRLRR